MPYLEMRGITKTFPGVVANRSVDFSVERGEIHGLVGENGAGKTTLMRILYGMYTADAGRITLDGQEASIPNPQTAIRLGIGMVHQEFQLVPSLTVAENIALGHEPTRSLFVDEEAMRARVHGLSEQFGLHVDPDVPVADLSVGVQQRVEILKLLYREAQLLILDEPTAVLTPQEVVALFEVLARLTEKGHTVIFITHKLGEVMHACQRATVLRRGEVTGTVEIASSSEAEIARLMVGREVQIVKRRPKAEFGPDKLLVDDLYARDDRGLPAVRGISFSVRQGEVVGLAGVEGNGQSELLETLAGLRPSEGRSVLDGHDLSHASARQRREVGLAIIPEDRSRQGLNLTGTVAENLVATRYYQSPLSRWSILNYSTIAAFARQLIERFDVRADSEMALAETLSGGNAQKVVVARELARRPVALVAAHPTRGLDIAAAQFVREEILRMRREGVAVLLISADLDEILALSDRILVIFEGRIVGELSPEEVTYERLGLLMAGTDQ
ncbi:MAG: ABC transporter ATP-binding protein [Anaerolineae bacterium]